MKEVIKYLKRKPNEELIQNKCTINHFKFKIFIIKIINI